MDFIGDILATPFICIGWIIVGAIAGSLARSLMKSDDMPFFADMLLGLGGALFGGLLAGLFGLVPEEGTSGLGLVLANLAIATAGAALLIGMRRTLTRA